jgi:hypothetical protein
VAFLSRKEPATALAIFRILIGAITFLTFADIVRLGLVDVLWLDDDFGGYRNLKPYGTIGLLGGPSPAVIWSYTAASLAFTAALTLGIGGPIVGRLIAFMALQTVMPLMDVNTQAGGSYDELLMNGMWLLVLAPATQTLSVDARIRTGSFVDDTPVLSWVRFVVVFQIVLVYWTTGLQKVSTYWVPGGDFSALYYILQQPNWQRYDLSFMSMQPLFVLTQVGTATSWFWEWLTPLWFIAFFISRKPGRTGWTRLVWAYAATGAVFHIGILSTLNVGPFSFASMAFYVCLLHPHDIAALRQKLGWRNADTT